MKTKVLVVGASGMLGHMLFHVLSKNSALEIAGAVRSIAKTPMLKELGVGRIFDGFDAKSQDSIEAVFKIFKPEIVVNCVGVIKQQPDGANNLECIELNSRLPHVLNNISKIYNSKFIHISTDCVFDGFLGNYTEGSTPTASDVYGMSKYLGEVTHGEALTIRTSIIGPELRGNLSLLEWFLSQKGSIKGYDQAIYSGLPTYELSKILEKIILERRDLKGLYQVASEPISKFDLLNLIKQKYRKPIEIIRFSDYKTDKSLSWKKLSSEIGYFPKSWEVLVSDMFNNDTNKEFRK